MKALAEEEVAALQKAVDGLNNLVADLKAKYGKAVFFEVHDVSLSGVKVHVTVPSLTIRSDTR